MPRIGDKFDTGRGRDNVIRLGSRGWSAQRDRRRTHPLRIVVIETRSMAVVRERVSGPTMCAAQKADREPAGQQDGRRDKAQDRCAVRHQSAAIFPLEGDQRHA